MSSRVIGNTIAVSTADEQKDRPVGRCLWPAIAFASFIGSGVCFLAGLLLSAVTSVGLIRVSRHTAYITVALLLTGFLLAFLGAHSIDKNAALTADTNSK